MSTLTAEREGVRIFLQAANTETDAAERLKRMYCARKDKSSLDAQALWEGHCAVSEEARTSIRELRDRGGLLHFVRGAS